MLKVVAKPRKRRGLPTVADLYLRMICKNGIVAARMWRGCRSGPCSINSIGICKGSLQVT